MVNLTIIQANLAIIWSLSTSFRPICTSYGHYDHNSGLSDHLIDGHIGLNDGQNDHKKVRLTKNIVKLTDFIDDKIGLDDGQIDQIDGQIGLNDGQIDHIYGQIGPKDDQIDQIDGHTGPENGHIDHLGGQKDLNDGQKVQSLIFDFRNHSWPKMHKIFVFSTFYRFVMTPEILQFPITSKLMYLR